MWLCWLEERMKMFCLSALPLMEVKVASSLFDLSDGSVQLMECDVARLLLMPGDDAMGANTGKERLRPTATDPGAQQPSSRDWESRAWPQRVWLSGSIDGRERQGQIECEMQVRPRNLNPIQMDWTTGGERENERQKAHEH